MEEARQFPYRLKSVRVSLPNEMEAKEIIIYIVIGLTLGAMISFAGVTFGGWIKVILFGIFILIILGIFIYARIKDIKLLKKGKNKFAQVRLFLLLALILYLITLSIDMLRIPIGIAYPILSTILMIFFLKKNLDITNKQKIRLWIIFIISNILFIRLIFT